MKKESRCWNLSTEQYTRCSIIYIDYPISCANVEGNQCIDETTEVIIQFLSSREEDRLIIKRKLIFCVIDNQ